MPTLDWIGKQAVINHHREVPTRLLHCDGALSAGDPDAGNLLVEGDNLEALKALLPYYAGQVKCIYIDPPYNTGNENWIYNDNVNSPEIRAWLGRVVGREAEDLTRHDKWLCMIYPRLRLLRDFLSPDGFILVSIDDIEFARLRLLMDGIFGQAGFVSCFVWKSRKFLDSRSVTNVSNDHEYILAYRVSETSRLKGAERDDEKFRNPDDDERGPWMSRSMLGLANERQRPNLHYPIIDPATGNVFTPPSNTGWRYSSERMTAMIIEGRVIFPKQADGRPREKKFKQDLQNQFMAIPSVIADVHTADGSAEIRSIFGEQVFEFPKPTNLIAMFLNQVTDGDCLVLDSFGGSGTTGHAALKLQAAGVDCRFILVEIDPNTAQRITAVRLNRAINGYADKVNADTPVPGLGSGFRYCTLGKPLFDEWGGITEGVTFPDLAAFVFFSDTGSPIPAKARADAPLIGTFQGRAIYLLWAADSAGVASEAAGNVLTPERLASLPLAGGHFDGSRTIYAEGCTVAPERLAAADVTFKQIPYQVAAA